MCDGELRAGTLNKNEGKHNPASAATRNAVPPLWGNHGPSCSNSVS
jgi:hypothetical protein